MDKAKELYMKIMETVDKGNDVEIRKDKDGNLVVYELRKKKIIKNQKECVD